METILQELLAAMQQDEPIPFDAIPSIDLYMDQVTTYLDSLLSSNLRSQEDKVFTKTMINNYTKDGLLPSPVKKKYTRCHLMLLIMIFKLKQTLSISDIGQLLSPVILNPDRLPSFYEEFCQIEQMQKQEFLSRTQQEFTEVQNLLAESQATEALRLYAMALAAQAASQKRLAEKILDQLQAESQK